MKFQRGCASQLLCLAVGVGSAAWAQADDKTGAAGQAAPAATPEADALPMTKNVVTRAAMDAMDTQDGYADAIKNVAGVSSNNAKGSANDSVKIRGIQLNLFTDYRLNGGLPITGVMSFPTENKERIEALKGANALMFGIASPAGIINLVTKRAGPVDVSALTVSGNLFGQYGAALDLGRRFGEDRQFGMRVNLSATHLENGIDGGSGSGKFASLAADWRVTRELTLNLDIERYSKDVVEQASVSLSPVDPKTGQIPVPRVPDPTKLLSGSWDVYRPRTQNYQLRALYRFTPGWKAQFEISRSSSQRWRLQDRIDIGNNLVSGIGDSNLTDVHNQYGTNFKKAEVLGQFMSGPLRHDLTFGIARTDRLINASNVTVIGTGRQNIYDPVVLPYPPLSNAPIVYTTSTSTNTGVYAYDAMTVAKDWKVLFGMRQTKSEFVNARGNSDSKTPSPALGVLYDVAPATTVYASYMKGLEEGATAPINKTTVNSGQVLPPAVAKQTEIGVRTSYFKGISASLAYFRIIRANAVTDPATNIFENEGTNNFRGFETTITADIDRAWSVNAAAQFLRAEQNAATSINGKAPENTPRLIANLGLTHRLQAIKGVTLTAGVSHVGERYINPLNQGVIPQVTLLTAGIGYATVIGGHRTSFQFSVDNLTNKRYWNSVTTGTYGAGMDRGFKFNVKTDF
ncbi:MAG: TonB-dependent siderophore receptor [Pseudomonadota bacterium]